ncbi:hypothetical protein ACEN2I_19455 [Flavobacterium sp. W22_SRS_FK3]|uniref:hypothetical protein n=1 Tax=Flavobacterium sp. W22_SRS_FK3 TaxID=3240275 RepID=UPI003F8EAD9E
MKKQKNKKFNTFCLCFGVLAMIFHAILKVDVVNPLKMKSTNLNSVIHGGPVIIKVVELKQLKSEIEPKNATDNK